MFCSSGTSSCAWTSTGKWNRVIDALSPARVAAPVEELSLVVLANAEDVQTDLVGVLDALEQLAHPIYRSHARPVSSKRAAKLSIPICMTP
jgi:hypothetical protein